MNNERVVKVRGHRFREGREEFRVKWSGSGVESWAPKEELSQYQNMLDEFDQRKERRSERAAGSDKQFMPTSEEGESREKMIKVSMKPNETLIRSGPDSMDFAENEAAGMSIEKRDNTNVFRSLNGYAEYMADLNDVPMDIYGLKVVEEDRRSVKKLEVKLAGNEEPVLIELDRASELCPSLVSKFYLRRLNPYLDLE